METKTCTCCGETKSLGDFSKHRNGLRAKCKSCCNLQSKKWRKENPEKFRELCKNWQENNKDKVKAKSRAHYQNMSTEERMSFIWYNASRNAPKRNLEFSITKKDVIDLWISQKGLCAYTKLPMTMSSYQLNSVSLDRVDSTIGYVLGNIQLVCNYVNRMKTNFKESEFILLCHLVSQNNKLVDNLDNLAVNH